MSALVVPMNPLTAGSFYAKDKEMQPMHLVGNASSSSSPSPSSTNCQESPSSPKNKVEEKTPIAGVSRCRYSLDAADEEEDDDETPFPTVVSQATATTTPSAVSPSFDPQNQQQQQIDDDSDSLPSLNDGEDDTEDFPELPIPSTPVVASHPLAGDDDDDSIPSLNDGEDDVPTPEAETPEGECSASEALDVPPFAGLYNLGNTCYLNSALQMVASLDGFRDQIRQHIPTTEESSDTPSLRRALLSVLDQLAGRETVRPDEFKETVDQRSPLFVGYFQQDSHEFLTTLLDLIDEDYKKTPEQENDEEKSDQEMADAVSEAASQDTAPSTHDEEMMEVSPKRLRMTEDEPDETMEIAVPAISASGSFKDLKFADIENLLHGDAPRLEPPSNQATSDSGDSSHKCKLVGGRMSNPGVPLTRWDDTSNDHDSSTGVVRTSLEGTDMSTSTDDSKPFSPVDDYFAAEVRVCLTCDSCKYRRSQTETYLHLSLEIGSTIGSIEEGLRAFFKPEKREVKCEKCFCESATQTMQLTKMPKALLFHLKRFIVDVSPDYSSVSYRKDQTAVLFDKTLEVAEHTGVLHEFMASDVVMPRNASYQIRSIVNHIGNTASCGHYTADGYRQSAGSSEREWLRFNDCQVSKISSAEVMENGSSTAYMILYELGQGSHLGQL
eukprot:Nitzschia sp. Nitz4//scaffold177_size45885//32499//34499//NITZ4_007210-RA/size45885-processed-gene-0.49-mRNA-1//-1//CDS//3329539070//3497//frame0